MFSIVIPIYNEAQNIKSLVYEIFNSLKDHNDFEVIIVNDFSSDNTIDVVNALKKKLNISLINNPKNKGQSFSIHKGVLKSKNNTHTPLNFHIHTPPRFHRRNELSFLTKGQSRPASFRRYIDNPGSAREKTIKRNGGQRIRKVQRVTCGILSSHVRRSCSLSLVPLVSVLAPRAMRKACGAP